MIRMPRKKTAEADLQLWQTAQPVEFKPKVADPQTAQATLINARQNPGFQVIAGQLGHALAARATDMLLDYSQNAVAMRYQIDGMWEQLPPLDRETGDAMLMVLKSLCGMNPADRRGAQQGSVGLKSARGKFQCRVRSQGVKTGERVLIHLENEKIEFETLADLGMREGQQTQLREALNGSGGIVVISAPKGAGLTTTWYVALHAADRFMRDFHSVEDKRNPDPEVINVAQHFYDDSESASASKVIRTLLLKEPDVLILPDLINDEIVKQVCDQIEKLNKQMVTRVVAHDAIEAIARLMAKHKAAAKTLLGKISTVTNQRLVRRLCDDCKQSFQPSPQLLQKLGIPQGRVSVLYRQFVPPPIEQQVDEKGRPAPIPPCPTCGGRGFYGRIAIFELLTMTPQLREAFTKTNDLGKLRAYAAKLGHKSLQQEAILTIARGLTSLEEVRRVMSDK